jgi:hypothetical protein
MVEKEKMSQWENQTAVGVEGPQENDKESEKTMKLMSDFPFKEIDGMKKDQKGGMGFQNKAPLQADEQARELLRNMLQHPISLTAEDLLNVSEPMKLELGKLSTKWKVEKKSVSFTALSCSFLLETEVVMCQLWPIENVMGYSGVFQGNPHLWPWKPMPAATGTGFNGHRAWVLYNS